MFPPRNCPRCSSFSIHVSQQSSLLILDQSLSDTLLTTGILDQSLCDTLWTTGIPDQSLSDTLWTTGILDQSLSDTMDYRYSGSVTQRHSMDYRYSGSVTLRHSMEYRYSGSVTLRHSMEYRYSSYSISKLVSFIIGMLQPEFIVIESIHNVLKIIVSQLSNTVVSYPVHNVGCLGLFL